VAASKKWALSIEEQTVAKDKGRPYDASDLKELMDNAGGWAKNWDDVLLYLKGPAPYDADFVKDEVPALIKDVSDLKEHDADFTTDYRQVWHEISGESPKDMKPPEGVKEPKTNPRELEDKYLKGLKFPARRADVLKAAKDNDAPPRVMDVLKKVDDKAYRDMGMLIEEVGDLTWDHD
jgi:hypothetical protein